MESESKEEDLTFNGFPIKKRGKVNAENLASSILSRGSIADLMHDFENEGVGLEQIDELRSTLSNRPPRGQISEDRRRALDRLQDARFSIIGSPPDLRSDEPMSGGESGRGKLVGPGKYAPGFLRGRIKKK